MYLDGREKAESADEIRENKLIDAFNCKCNSCDPKLRENVRKIFEQKYKELIQQLEVGDDYSFPECSADPRYLDFLKGQQAQQQAQQEEIREKFDELSLAIHSCASLLNDYVNSYCSNVSNSSLADLQARIDGLNELIGAPGAQGDLDAYWANIDQKDIFIGQKDELELKLGSIQSLSEYEKLRFIIDSDSFTDYQKEALISQIEKCETLRKKLRVNEYYDDTRLNLVTDEGAGGFESSLSAFRRMIGIDDPPPIPEPLPEPEPGIPETPKPSSSPANDLTDHPTTTGENIASTDCGLTCGRSSSIPKIPKWSFYYAVVNLGQYQNSDRTCPQRERWLSTYNDPSCESWRRDDAFNEFKEDSDYANFLTERERLNSGIFEPLPVEIPEPPSAANGVFPGIAEGVLPVEALSPRNETHEPPIANAGVLQEIIRDDPLVAPEIIPLIVGEDLPGLPVNIQEQQGVAVNQDLPVPDNINVPMPPGPDGNIGPGELLGERFRRRRFYDAIVVLGGLKNRNGLSKDDRRRIERENLKIYNSANDIWRYNDAFTEFEQAPDYATFFETREELNRKRRSIRGFISRMWRGTVSGFKYAGNWIKDKVVSGAKRVWGWFRGLFS